MANLQKLEALNNLVVGELSDSFVSLRVFANETPFVSFWHQPQQQQHQEAAAVSFQPFSMKYLPLFYVIASLDQEGNLSLKLITFHGKLIDEVNEANEEGELSPEDVINFISKLSYLHLCQGVQFPDVQSKLDLKMFSSLYVLEHLEENVTLRSVHCNFALCPEDLTCDACTALSNVGGEIEKPISLGYPPLIDNTMPSQETLNVKMESNEARLALQLQVYNDNETVEVTDESKALVIYTNEKISKRRAPSNSGLKIKSLEASEQKTNVNSAETGVKLPVKSKKLKVRKPHKCPHCTHTTRKRQHLKDHIRAIHEKIKTF